MVGEAKSAQIQGAIAAVTGREAMTVQEAIENIAASAGRPVFVILGQGFHGALDYVLALPQVCAVARGRDVGMVVFAAGSAPPMAALAPGLFWHRLANPMAPYPGVSPRFEEPTFPRPVHLPPCLARAGWRPPEIGWRLPAPPEPPR